MTSTNLGWPEEDIEDYLAKYQRHTIPRKENNQHAWLETWTGTPEEALIRLGLRQDPRKPAPIRECCGVPDYDVSNHFRKAGYTSCSIHHIITNLIEPSSEEDA